MNDRDPDVLSTTQSEGNYIPSTKQKWHTWLSEEESRTFRVYTEDPNRFLADYRSEQQTVRDYEGREILELLQNANDAAAEKGEISRVVIDLSPEGLVVGNTGHPFSTGGIRSLRLAHLSPKSSQKKQFVGNKGLGFRSVLNWTSTPIILSGELCLAYSRSYLDEKQQQAFAQIPSLLEIIQAEASSSTRKIIPLLTFPCIPPDGILEPFLENNSQISIYKRCQQLCKEGLETVVGMSFDKAESYERALVQIKDLGHETLLFAPNLGELEIKITGTETKQDIWIRELKNGTAQIISTLNDDLWTYKIFRKEGKIPVEFLTGELEGSLDYEVVLAVPDKKDIKSGYLYSFFRTGARFPFPLLAHATLELQANRELPQDIKANRFVLAQLASLMTSTAELVASPDNSWAGCRLLSKDISELPPVLTKLDFETVLIADACKKSILPTLKGEIRKPEECCQMNIKKTSWLPSQHFPDLVEASSDDNIFKFINELKIKKLEQHEWLKILNILEFSSIKERAIFISGLIENSLISKNLPIRLLIDESGNPIPDDCRIFLAPKENKKHSLPDWLKIRFLNSEMVSIIQNQIDIGRRRILVKELSVWDIKEYSLDTVISSLVAETNRRIKENDEKQDKYSEELLKVLLNLFPEEQENRPLFPKDAGLRLKSQTGCYSEVRKLYFGEAYGKYGALMQALYGSFDQEKILSSPKELDLYDVEIERPGLLFDFFSWLGVAKLPREMSEDKSKESDYKEYVLTEISYPAILEDIRRNSITDWSYYAQLEKVKTIDSLSDILKNAGSEVVLTWLSVDERFKEWNSWSKSHGRLLDCNKYQQKLRYYSEELPCYIPWKIRNSEWISTSTGKCKPGDCFFGEKRFGKLLTKPKINQEHPLFVEFGVWPNIVDAFDRSGVLTRISYLERDLVYRLLMDLPEKDPKGKSSQNLYTLLLTHEESFFGNAEKTFSQFKKNGKLWGRHGDKIGYYPVSDLHYITDDVPVALAENIKIIDLPKRYGPLKVERFFGVQPVNKSKIEYHIKNACQTKSADWINSEFKSIKPILYALRQAKSAQSPFLSAFKRLNIVVCNEIEGFLVYNGIRYPLTLRPWEWLLDDDSAYILQDSKQNISSISDDLLADTIGSVIAAIFRLENGSEFARLIPCSKSNRVKLLEKMLGGETIPDLEALTEEFEVVAKENDFKFDIPDYGDGEADDVAGEEGDDDGDDNQDENETPIDKNDSEQDSDEDEDQVPLEVGEKEHAPSKGKHVRLRIQKKPSKGGNRRTGSHLVTDGEFCEKKAMEFELTDSPPRYPLHVGRVTGYNGPKCDILSFASMKNRQIFEKSKNPELISRFIEVKGRSSGNSSIILKGNELNAAKNYADRYFLYRLYVASDGNYELSILQDPLQDPGASIDLMEINFEYASLTRRFDLHGGIIEGNHNLWNGNELPDYVDNQNSESE